MNSKALEFARTWNKKWFGFWGREKDVTSQPFSLDEHIDQNWLPDDRQRLIEYIRFAPVAVIAQGAQGKCGLCEELVRDSCYRSDGEWLWPDSLSHLVEKHFFVLPDSMVIHIREKEYRFPQTLDVALSDLPWP